MKRVVALVMVVVLMVMGTAALADSQKDSEKYIEELKWMYMKYEIAKDNFDDESVMYTYINLMLAINAQSSEYYMLAKSIGGDAAIETAKTMTWSGAMFSQRITDAYIKYVNGEMKKSDFLKVLIPMVEGIF